MNNDGKGGSFSSLACNNKLRYYKCCSLIPIVGIGAAKKKPDYHAM